MIVADLEQLISKSKLGINAESFVELYNQRNYGQVYEIYVMIEFGKIYALTAKNPHNLSINQINEISLVLYNAQIVFRD